MPDILKGRLLWLNAFAYALGTQFAVLTPFISVAVWIGYVGVLLPSAPCRGRRRLTTPIH
jgi:hypothetical protein